MGERITSAAVDERRSRICAAAAAYRTAMADYTDALREYRALAVRDASRGHPSLHTPTDTAKAATAVINREGSLRGAKDKFYAAVDACPIARWQLLERYSK